MGVLEVYPARERGEDFPDVTGRLIAEAAADAGEGKTVLWLPDFDAAERALAPLLRAGDILLVLGEAAAAGRMYTGRRGPLDLRNGGPAMTDERPKLGE